MSYIHKENEGSLKKKDKKMSEINEVVLATLTTTTTSLMATMESCDVCVTGVPIFPLGFIHVDLLFHCLIDLYQSPLKCRECALEW